MRCRAQPLVPGSISKKKVPAPCIVSLLNQVLTNRGSSNWINIMTLAEHSNCSILLQHDKQYLSRKGTFPQEHNDVMILTGSYKRTTGSSKRVKSIFAWIHKILSEVHQEMSLLGNLRAPLCLCVCIHLIAPKYCQVIYFLLKVHKLLELVYNSFSTKSNCKTIEHLSNCQVQPRSLAFQS